MSAINTVKFFFLEGNKPTSEKLIQQMTTLAYQTATKQNIYPKQILLRCVYSLRTIHFYCHAYFAYFDLVALDTIHITPPIIKQAKPKITPITIPFATKARNMLNPEPTLLVMVIQRVLTTTRSEKQLSLKQSPIRP